MYANEVSTLVFSLSFKNYEREQIYQLSQINIIKTAN